MLDTKKKKDVRSTNKPASGSIGLKILNGIFTLLAILFASAATLAFRSYHWAMNTWSELSMEEIVYHMNTTIEGADDMIGQYIKACVIITVVVLLLLIVVFILLRKKRVITHILQAVLIIASVVVMVNTYSHFNKDVGVSDYMEAQETYSSFIDDNYVDPNDVQLTFPEKKRNLVYIFLESMENTYSDEASGGAFPENCIPELTQISMENENFSGSEGGLNGGIPLKGSTWTIGAMFAQTSGLPLNLPIDKNAMSTQNDFFPGVTALGDILKNNGYAQTLCIGSDAAFGGRDLYFKGHGDFTIKDYYAAINDGKIPSDYYVWWGFEDKYLMDNAKEEMTKLASGTQPFNFTMLTVDTHFEDGYVCSDCEGSYGTQYSNVMACSSKKINELVGWIKQQPWYENTTIVISGDHLTMDRDYCEDVPDNYERTVYTTVINAPLERETQDRRTICTFDNFPTTLAALGVEIEGNRLGLGTNLYSSEPTLLERYSVKEANEGLQQKSELMDNLLAGINTKLADCKISDYNPVTKTISVEISDIQYKKPLRSIDIQIYGRKDKKDIKYYKMNDDGDGTYSFEIPMMEHNANGVYNIQVLGDTDDPSLTKIPFGTKKVTVEDPTFTETLESMEVLESKGTLIVEDYNAETDTMNIYAVDVETPNGVMDVSCAVWSKGDQSDLRWIGATEVDDGIYLMQVHGSDFGQTKNTLSIHLYITDMQGEAILLHADKAELIDQRTPEEIAADQTATDANTPDANAAGETPVEAVPPTENTETVTE